MKNSLFAHPPESSPHRQALVCRAYGLSLAVILCCLCMPAMASEPEPANESWVEMGFLNQFDADFDDDDGTFDVRGGYGRTQIMIELSEGVRIRTRASFYGASYEYDEPPNIAGSKFKPFNTILVARLNPMLDLQLTDEWTVFGGPLLEASLENSADLANSLKYGGSLGAMYRFSPTLSAGAGIIAVSEIEDSFYMQPLLLLDWKPLPKLTVHAESWTTRGGRIEMAYRVLDQLEIGTSVSYRRERFRLKSRTLAPGPPAVPRTGSRGVAEDRSVIPAVRISYLPDAEFAQDILGPIRIDLEAGVALAGDIRIENKNGSGIQTMNYDAAPILELKLFVPVW